MHTLWSKPGKILSKRQPRIPDVNILVLNKTSKSSSRSGIPVSNGLKFILQFRLKRINASSAKLMSAKNLENLPDHLRIYHRIESIFRSLIQRKLKIPRRKDFLSCSYLQIEEFERQRKVEGSMR